MGGIKPRWPAWLARLGTKRSVDLTQGEQETETTLGDVELRRVDRRSHRANWNIAIGTKCRTIDSQRTANRVLTGRFIPGRRFRWVPRVQ